MVIGIDSFRDKFKDYTNYYTVIGGTACDIFLLRCMHGSIFWNEKEWVSM